ncbi:hypothetical protein JZO70_05475 [Enterococcus sp. 669A]|uniref:Uncharacterized protein n=1 Tax=Candidatus Enterococcus moelleringii TaxID=2815325 RepID=A0ABS3L967_9ENTE|nr:hypothetical protein [Enterococcus sp. 669A]MBO1305598.1 hypothetical protein [Enterococcus sp. 669A]
MSKLPTCTPRTGPWPIHLVLPIPDMKGTLVIYDQEMYCYSSHTTRTTLYHDNSDMIIDYPATGRTLKRLPFFQKQRHPMINQPHVLFPLARPADSIWINPLSIEEVWEEPTETYVKMASGPGIIIEARKRTVDRYATNALMALACSIRDIDPTAGTYRNHNPLNYLDLIDTPYIQEICKSSDMRAFPIEEGVYRERFYTQRNNHRMLKAYDRLDESSVNHHTMHDFIDDFE